MCSRRIKSSRPASRADVRARSCRARSMKHDSISRRFSHMFQFFNLSLSLVSLLARYMLTNTTISDTQRSHYTHTHIHAHVQCSGHRYVLSLHTFPWISPHTDTHTYTRLKPKVFFLSCSSFSIPVLAFNVQKDNISHCGNSRTIKMSARRDRVLYCILYTYKYVCI